ncbi:MAG: hypothetical protein GY952_14100 [Rhodobacteraceae bacterium]|nr:hypothetical protein [Paracoccaceae bacterium]
MKLTSTKNGVHWCQMSRLYEVWVKGTLLDEVSSQSQANHIYNTATSGYAFPNFLPKLTEDTICDEAPVDPEVIDLDPYTKDKTKLTAAERDAENKRRSIMDQQTAAFENLSQTEQAEATAAAWDNLIDQINAAPGSVDAADACRRCRKPILLSPQRGGCSC